MSIICEPELIMFRSIIVQRIALNKLVVELYLNTLNFIDICYFHKGRVQTF